MLCRRSAKTARTRSATCSAAACRPASGLPLPASAIVRSWVKGVFLGTSIHTFLFELGWPPFLHADACEGEKFGGILWSLTQINTTSYGSCKPGYIALNAISPQRLCRSDKTWDSTITGNCTGAYTKLLGTL